MLFFEYNALDLKDSNKVENIVLLLSYLNDQSDKKQLIFIGIYVIIVQ